ncbi:MAG: hypothetical protein OHK0029_08710 [Armatimonadaceae bacterium]
MYADVRKQQLLVGISAFAGFLILINWFLLRSEALVSNTGESGKTAASQAISSEPATHGHSGGDLHTPNVQSFGNRHVEAQLTGNTLRFYFYGGTEKELQPVAVGSMEVEALLAGEDPQPISLAARPYPGETEGFSSRFEGQLPATVPGETPGLSMIIALDQKNYRVQWRPEMLSMGGHRTALEQEILDAEREEHARNTMMPTALSADADGNRALPTPEEQALFLTPGGLYTASDITANGNQVPAIRYRGEMAQHDKKPKAGDSLCPITDTVANPRFTWVVNGKTYRFCCPPCIEEFVRMAKEEPESIKAPEDYIKP